MQSQELLPECEVFENEIVSRTESTENPAEDMSEAQNHAAILSETQHRAGLQVIDFASARGFDEA